jgi:hypothetical protein
MSLGSKSEVVNANVFAIFFGSTNEYILATRKEFDFRAEQKRVPTGAGPVYFTMLSNDRLLLELAYTTGEVGTSLPQAFDEMMKRNASTGEVPTNLFTIKATDRAGAPVTKNHPINAKCTRFRGFAGAEGETLVSLELQIIDNEPSVT